MATEDMNQTEHVVWVHEPVEYELENDVMLTDVNLMPIEEPVGNVTIEPVKPTLGVRETYLNVLLDDTETRAAKYVGRAEFRLAKTAVKNANDTVLSYKDKVDQQYFQQCMKRLEEVSRMILTQEQRWKSRWDTRVSEL